MNDQERKELRELMEWKKDMQSAHTFPIEVYRAMQERLGQSTTFSVSSKGADSEDQTVDENGTGVYSVMADPAGFLQVEINGVIYYIPYFS